MAGSGHEFCPVLGRRLPGTVIWTGALQTWRSQKFKWRYMTLTGRGSRGRYGLTPLFYPIQPAWIDHGNLASGRSLRTQGTRVMNSMTATLSPESAAGFGRRLPLANQYSKLGEG